MNPGRKQPENGILAVGITVATGMGDGPSEGSQTAGIGWRGAATWRRHMNRSWTFTSAVIVAALSVAALPAGAQGRERGGRPGGGGGQGGGGQAPRQQSARQAAPRQAPPQARQSAPPQAAQSAPPQARAERAAAGSRRARRRRRVQGASRATENRQYRRTGAAARVREPAASDRSAGDAAHEREPAVLRRTGEPRGIAARALFGQQPSRCPTAPQATPRAQREPAVPPARRRSRAGTRRLSIRPLSLRRT